MSHRTPQEMIEKIEKYPSFIEDLKQYELEMTKDYCDERIDTLKEKRFRRLEPFYQSNATKDQMKVHSMPLDDSINQYENVKTRIRLQLMKISLVELKDITVQTKSLTNIEELALKNVCKGARKENKRPALKDYLMMKSSNPGQKDSDIIKMLDLDYEIETSTFYNWINKLNEEIKSITLSQNE